MITYIYDIEVYKHNWLFKARRPEDGSPFVTIWDDNYALREWFDNVPDIVGGFNNKHYDDWIVLTMLLGGSNVEVKRHNDFIIGGGDPWAFPFIQFQKKPFKSFDLRDDIADKGLSLKAVEGNLNMPIVECTEVPFDIDRPLTDNEKKIVEKYCEHDVNATVRLYKARSDYLVSKKVVSSIYGVQEAEGLGLTNAKLSARVLNAKAVKRDDERDYRLPDCLDPNLIPEPILNFFMQIRDLSIPDTKLFGTGKQGSKGETLKLWIETSGGRCPVTYAWGGVHGAKPAFIAEATDDRLIVNYDVASLYPNSMINFGYCSRSMADPDAYKKLVDLRLSYKAEAKRYSKKIVQKLGDGWYKKYDSEELPWDCNLDAIRKDADEETFKDIEAYVVANSRQSALKLVINTTYGAMLNLFNDLADRRAGRSVCITNQLAMTQLIVMLSQRCVTIDFININTDGIMFYIDRSEDALASEIVEEWSKITRFEMERDDFAKVIQKDVNNYIGIMPDGKFKTKGGFVSLYKGGNFKTNSLQIIHKAVVDYLVKGISPEDTINGETDIFKFQQIVKTGGSFEGSYHYVNGVREEIQKVNRIYAVKDPKYGQVVKGKWITEKRRKDKATGKMVSEPVNPPVWSESTVPECPEHTFIDNENVLTVDDLDKSYYIEMAKGRIDKYINLDSKVKRELEKIKEVVSIMANAKTETASNEAVATMNIYGKLIEARKQFLAAGVKKTGKNLYAEYKYFTLDDIIPVKTRIFEDLGLVDVISFTETGAILTLINVSNPEEQILFMSPTDKDESLIKNPIQKLGAVETYVRRYLYMLVLDIVESDGIEAVADKPDGESSAPLELKAPKKAGRPKTEKERTEIKEDLIDKGGEATETQIKAIKNGLKKLRAKDGDKYEDYVTASVKRIKSGLTKTEAENLLIEIGEKVAE
jgi:hypothetical protein